MMSLMQYINEAKEDLLMSISKDFKDGEDSMLSMIAKRMMKWDANNGKYSREPMFLCDWNRQTISWATVESLQIELGDNEGHIDGGTNYKLFDGFLKEYMSGETTPNDQYILGVFMDRCFIPIPDKGTFEKIWKKVAE